MQKFKAAKCPNCGGELQLPTDVDSVNCMYCGSSIVVREALAKTDNTKNIENLMSMADTAYAGTNYEEAYNYYNQVLEMDHANYMAWAGKAMSAGWSSTLAISRLAELKPAVSNAMKHSPNDRKQEVSENICTELGKVFSGYVRLATDHFDKHAYTENELGMKVILEDAANTYDAAMLSAIKAQSEVISVLGDNDIEYPSAMVENFFGNAIEAHKIRSKGTAMHAVSSAVVDPWIDPIYDYAKSNGYTSEHPRESEEVVASAKKASSNLTWGVVGVIIIIIIAGIIVASQ